jgi:alpha-tubulin suppressor-like RCC1 family protein
MASGDSASRPVLRCGLVVPLVAVCLLTRANPVLGASNGAFGWGENARGELGSAGVASSDVPLAVGGLDEVSAVSAGADFSLALLSNGTVMAWGENGFGQLGNATAGVDSYIPVPVSGLSEVAAIAAGGNHALALLRDGTVEAWGYNAFGQLGDGETGYENSSDVPVAVSGLSEVTAVAAGYNDSFALLRDGTVEAWGYNASGELGTGSTTEANPTPARVSGLSEVTAISAGLGGVSTALLSDGTVMDWGYGQFGELGDGSDASSEVPVPVSGLSGVVALPNGGESMALLGNGTVVDWGLNSSGQLGEGSEGWQTSSDVPVPVSGLSGVRAIAGGFEQRLALLGNGHVVAWGNGAGGSIGDGAEGSDDAPVEVSGLSGITSIAAGQYFSLAAAYPPLLPSATVSKVEPAAGPLSGGTSVTIEGTNFAEVTAVDFGSTPASSFTVNSDTSITAVAPPLAGGNAIAEVTVTTPSGASRYSIGDSFIYEPAVTEVEPNNGPPSGGTSVTITGGGFEGDFLNGAGEVPPFIRTVKFGSADATSFKVDSGTEITAVAPPGTGTVDVTVETFTGARSSTGSADEFSYEAPPVIEPLGSGRPEPQAGGTSSSSPPGVTPLVSGPGRTIKPTVLLSTEKLVKGLEQCRKEPKHKRTACQKRVRKSYATVARKSRRDS